MAIYHCSVKALSRSSGRSATAAAAYRSAAKIIDQRTGEIHDYTRKRGVASSELIYPKSCTWRPPAGGLWNAAEAAENRKNSTVAREIIIAIPAELDDEQRAELVRRFAVHIAEQYQVGVQADIHAPDRRGDDRNHHAHLLLTTRRITPDGLGAKTRELDDRATGKDEVTRIRKAWELHINAALQQAGSAERVSCESLAAQGSDAEPTQHEGPQITEMRRRGALTSVARANDCARSSTTNRNNRGLKMEIDDMSNEIADLIAAAKAKQAQADEQAANGCALTGKSTRKPTLEWLAAQPQHDGSTIYSWPKSGAPVMRDAGDRLDMLGMMSQAKVRAMVDAARDKGWTEIEITGPPEFAEAAARQAARAGVRIANDDPELQKIWQAERGKQHGKIRAGAAVAPTLPGGFFAPPPAPVAKPPERPEVPEVPKQPEQRRALDLYNDVDPDIEPHAFAMVGDRDRAPEADDEATRRPRMR